MNMNIVLGLILIPLTGVLIFAIKVHLKEVRVAKEIEIERKKPKLKTFEELSQVINTSYSSLDQLDAAVSEILSRFVNIKDCDVYEKLLQKLCTHKNSSSKIILNFEKTLSEYNKSCKSKLNKALEIGMKARKLR